MVFFVCWKWFVHFLMFVHPFCHKFQESREDLSPDHLRLPCLPMSKGLTVKGLSPRFVPMQNFSEEGSWSVVALKFVTHLPPPQILSLKLTNFTANAFFVPFPLVMAWAASPRRNKSQWMWTCWEMFFAANTIWIFKALNMYVLFISSVQMHGSFIFEDFK